MAKVLEGVRILDLTRVIAGPWCTQTLADLGAEVIKVEKPGSGDDTRRVGPFVRTSAQGDSAFYMGVNRNKQSVTIDISTPEGAELVRELAARCDVLVENYKVGDLKRYGLDYETLTQSHPSLIYCSVTGFGQDGPYAARPAYDSVLQAMCGLMSTCGHPDDEQGAGPMRSAVPVADIFTGLYAAIAVMGAIMQCRDTGRGQYIDMAMVDVATAVMGHLALGYLMNGEIPQRQGNSNPITAPSGVFRASDGYFSMSAGNDHQFLAMLHVLGLPPELAHQERFGTNIERIRHRKELDALLQAVTFARPVAEWVDKLSAHKVPCAAINDMRQVFADPQVKHRELHLNVLHASGEQVPTLRSPLRLPLSPVTYAAAPTLGQHTQPVLSEVLAKSEAQIASLRACGVITTA
ncbi:CaiB/BaiF CoA transferase family protein [Comamonas testosteroni]|uniref:CaiB/BaiF CoA transferase family protein n=1 Tax=Comamonas testosteroni TaxID=285 RepID=UPI0005B3733B|nr:CoA transferase [Comamonas testosteroni]